MRKYDKIYVPDEKGEFKVQQFYEDYYEWTDIHDGTGDVSAQSNVIVMTIEELREMWDKAENHAFNEARMGAGSLDAKNFHNYLTSKGIDIKLS